MKNTFKIKAAALGMGAVLLTLICLIPALRGKKEPEHSSAEVLQEQKIDSPQDSETEETEPRLGSHPDINTDIGANSKRITPGGVEYSFIDTAGMTPEEIAEMERRLDEEAGYAYEPNPLNGSADRTTGKYINSELSCTFPSGSILRIGVNGADSKALYLNPVYEAVEEENVFSEEETAFAFYFRTQFGDDISTSWNEQASYDQGANLGHKYFVVKDRTYDTLVPAEYLDSTNYGVRWTDLNNLHGFDGSDYDMSIRVVRLPDGQLMGTAKLHIAFDDASGYSISYLVNSDVSVTGELTDAERREVLEKAYAFFCSDDKGQSTFVDQQYWEAYRSKAVVEKADWFYFGRLFDAQGNVISAGKLSGIRAYAVNINYPGYGFATIYCASQQQINGMRGSAAENGELQPFAFDAFKPFSRSTLFVPSYQEDAFYQ